MRSTHASRPEPRLADAGRAIDVGASGALRCTAQFSGRRKRRTTWSSEIRPRDDDAQRHGRLLETMPSEDEFSIAIATAPNDYIGATSNILGKSRSRSCLATMASLVSEGWVIRHLRAAWVKPKCSHTARKITNLMHPHALFLSDVRPPLFRMKCHDR